MILYITDFHFFISIIFFNNQPRGNGKGEKNDSNSVILGSSYPLEAAKHRTITTRSSRERGKQVTPRLLQLMQITVSINARVSRLRKCSSRYNRRSATPDIRPWKLSFYRPPSWLNPLRKENNNNMVDQMFLQKLIPSYRIQYCATAAVYMNMHIYIYIYIRQLCVVFRHREACFASAYAKYNLYKVFEA